MLSRGTRANFVRFLGTGLDKKLSLQLFKSEMTNEFRFSLIVIVMVFFLQEKNLEKDKALVKDASKFLSDTVIPKMVSEF